MAVRVKGYGGCGQTAVLRAYGDKAVNHHSDNDGQKHNRISTCPSETTLYVYCHPQLAARSHYKRAWPKHQAKKTNPDGPGVPDTIDEYLKGAIQDEENEGFGFMKHFESHIRCDNVLPVTLSDFEGEQTRDKIAAFTGFPVPKIIRNKSEPLTNSKLYRNSKLDGPALDATWQKMRMASSKKWSNELTTL